MALKRIIRQPKAVKPRITKTKVLSIDLKYNGVEPLEVTASNYAQALNWYNYQHENDQSREWLLEYLKKNSTKEIYQAVRKAPKWSISSTVGWQARIMMNGNTLSEKSMEFFDTRIAGIVEEASRNRPQEDTSAITKPTVTIQERTQAKIKLLITECEQTLDENPNLDIYTWLKDKEASTPAATAICDYYSKWLQDFEYVDEYETKTTKKYREAQLKYLTQFVYDCQRYLGNKKVVKIRKPREKKTRSAVDQVKNLKFQKEFPPLKIVSVNPGEVIGCRQLWAYNTKLRKLTRYDALGPNGIQVKGTTLIGFDVEKSLTKSLRKPELIIPALLGAGKIALRSFIEDIKTNQSAPTGRINIDTILLRVVK